MRKVSFLSGIPLTCDCGVQLHSLKLILIILLSWMLQRHANMIGNVDFHC